MDENKPRRRWLSFGIRDLLWAMVVLGLEIVPKKMCLTMQSTWRLTRSRFGRAVTLCPVIASLVISVVGSRADDNHEKPATPTFVGEFGVKGTEPGQFMAPIDIAINSDDEVFISDARLDRVQRFTQQGDYIDKADTDVYPGGMAIDQLGLIYVASMMAHKISVYRIRRTEEVSPKPLTAFELVREWGTFGSDDGQFNQPGGMAFGLDGSLYVCDQVNHRVQQFTAEGRFVSKWGKYGHAPGEFGAPEPVKNRIGGPCMITCDAAGNLYTTEPTAGRIQQFTSDGRYVRHWGSNERKEGGFGGGRNLQGPIAILSDLKDKLWVSATNHRVQSFTTAGDYLTGLGKTAEPGPAHSEFRVPHGMAINSQGILYVVDTQNHRIQLFDTAAK